MAKEEKISDRTPQTSVGGVTPSQLAAAQKSCNTLESKMGELRGDKAAALDRFKNAGGNKWGLKTAMKIDNADEPAVGQDNLNSALEYLKAFGFIKSFKIEYAQGALEVKGAEDHDDDSDGEETDTPKKAAAPRSIGQKQADAFMSAH